MVNRGDLVRLRVIDQDRYGRTVAQVIIGNRDAGLELVRQGRAVVYEQYNDSSVYRQAEDEAGQAGGAVFGNDPVASRTRPPGGD